MLLRTFRAFPKGLYRIQELDQKCTCNVRSWRRYTVQTHSQPNLNPSYTPSTHNYKTIEADIQKLLDTANHYSLSGLTLVKHMRNMVAGLREEGFPLTPAIYEALLNGYINSGKRNKVMPLLREMEDDGLTPTLTFINRGLAFASWSGDALLQAKLLDRMRYYGFEKTAETYNLIMHCIWKNQELERALDTLDEMKARGIVPTASNYMIAVKLALQYNESSVAFDMLERAEKVENITERHWYLTALRCAVLSDDYPSVKANWKFVTKDQLPDDGLCKNALLVAARFNDPQLAYDVLFTVGNLGYPYSDHHFNCLLESFASTMDYKNMFRVFTAMRKAGVPPTKTTGTPVVQHLGKDLNAVIQARQALVDLRQASDSVDSAAFNLIIHSFAYNGAFDEAMATFDMADTLAVVPDQDTLDALLDACIHQRSAHHGEVLLAQFTAKGIQPSAVSLSKMVVLMCTQDNFEDAFVYLEKIKKTGQLPLRGAYYRLVKKLAASNDPRLAMAIEDMEACGYTVSTHMDEYMDDKALIHEKRERKRLERLASDDVLY